MKKKTAHAQDITRLIKPQVRKLAAYHIDETPCRIKLDAMENPFPLPKALARETANAIKTTLINRYPDPSAKKLKQSICRMWGMKPENTILGNGSDELIQMIVLAFGGPVVTPSPSFAMYSITAKALSQEVITVPLNEDFSLDADTLLREASKSKAKVIFLACPNNPTGNRFSDPALRTVLDNARAAVVIDEAYFSFSGKSHLRLLNKYPNMIILRTLSKIGLAGLRIGSLTASSGIIEELNKIRLPYNINSLSQVAAAIALEHRDILDQQISLLISERKKLYNALSQLKNISVYPSETNFILFRTSADATIIYQKLKTAGILIKNLNRPGPLKNCLRVTIGTPPENKEFVAVLMKIMDQSKQR